MKLLSLMNFFLRVSAPQGALETYSPGKLRHTHTICSCAIPQRIAESCSLLLLFLNHGDFTIYYMLCDIPSITYHYKPMWSTICYVLTVILKFLFAAEAISIYIYIHIIFYQYILLFLLLLFDSLSQLPIIPASENHILIYIYIYIIFFGCFSFCSRSLYKAWPLKGHPQKGPFATLGTMWGSTGHIGRGLARGEIDFSNNIAINPNTS